MSIMMCDKVVGNQLRETIDKRAIIVANCSNMLHNR